MNVVVSSGKVETPPNVTLAVLRATVPDIVHFHSMEIKRDNEVDDVTDVENNRNVFYENDEG